MNLFGKLSDIDLYLRLCEKVGADEELVWKFAEAAVAWQKGGREDGPYMEMESKWYDSLEEGDPWWDVYATDEYLGELWACWMFYSRKYLKQICSAKAMENGSIVEDMGSVGSVVDLGCGAGYTTVLLADVFPEADVVGTNVEAARQTKMACLLGRRFGFSVVADVKEIDSPVDLIFASEYFEHWQSSVDHLVDVLNCLEPKSLLIANAFGARAIGHFDVYKVKADGFGFGMEVEGKTMSRLFNKTLRSFSYELQQTKLWNNRPAYWKKK